MESRLATRHLVLIGAGHTHLHVLRMWRMKPIPDVQLTLVSPFSQATYSGMLPGTLAGLYQPGDMQVDLYRFAHSCGARLIVEAAVGLDPQSRHVHFADRPPLPFDVASIGIGSVPSGAEIWTRHRQVVSVKPMQTFLSRLHCRLEQASRARAEVHSRELAAAGTGRQAALTGEFPVADDSANSGASGLQVGVVGAGAAGVEIALCLDAYLKKQGRRAELSLIESSDTVLPGYAKRTVELATRELQRRRITVRLDSRAKAYEQGELWFGDGDSQKADVVIWAAGAAPPDMLTDFDLPKAEDGFLAVRPTLQTTAGFPVFAVGDTATFPDIPVPKAGVYAVREGPILWDNIRRILAGRPLKEYDPQKNFLSLMATGDGRAIAQYRGLAAHGRWVWMLKNYIDRKFMRSYQDYRPMPPEGSRQSERRRREENASAARMRCRGCGGKASANVLAAALDRLDGPPGETALHGLKRPDDAAILSPKMTAEVVSVDFFQSFLDDPYLVGRVAALNAMSDLWAMGAQPVGAMAMVSLPEGDQSRQADLLHQLLAGGLRELSAAGAALLGGHTTESSELTIGYTVLGRLNGSPPLTKSNLRAGDRLILTKPLGTGVLLAGHAGCAAKAEWIDAMLNCMLSSNSAAAAIARELEVEAATDITGFGLAGHLLEMLEASRVDACLRLGALPLLAGFRELSDGGVRSSLFAANRQAEDRIEHDATGLDSRAEYKALFDPQTSGGLLLAVHAGVAEIGLGRLRDAGYADAAVVGHVLSESSRPILRVSS